MAVNHERDNRDSLKKASSLEGDALSAPSLQATKTEKRSKDTQGDRALTGKRRSVWKGLVADGILLLLLAGVVFGIWRGYNAVKSIYAPVWSQREIEICIKISNIDYDRADELLPGLYEHPLWHSDAADGVRLGNVSDVRAIPSTIDGREIMTLYLTVSVTAQYRNGEGYFVEDVRLLAGERAIYRANGLVAEGTMISLTDPQVAVETAAPEADTEEVLA